MTRPLLLPSLFFTSISFGQAWTQKGLDLDGEAQDDSSGWSVSMPDAGTVAIGAPNNNGWGPNAGHVRIYAWDGTAWLQKGADINGESTNDRSGESVCMPDPYTVAIGAMGNDGNGIDAGHTRIYAWNGTAWAQKGADIDGEGPGDRSGIAVSMPDSNTVAIGAANNSDNRGHVRVYAWNNDSWTQQGEDIDGEAVGDWSGASISMPDAGTVAIGAFLNDGTASNSGHVRVYDWNGTTWVQRGADLDGEAMNDRSGISVNMPDTQTVAIGAYWNDGNGDNAGHVRVHTWNGASWEQRGTDLDGEGPGDQSGRSVCMPDGNTLAVGAINDPGTGIGAGHVRVYVWTGTSWEQHGADLDGEAELDASGRSVSMPNAGTVAIGAPRNSGSAEQAGHVRVFEYTPSTTLPEIGRHEVAAYPNPTCGELALVTGGVAEEYSVSVKDILGRVIHDVRLLATDAGYTCWLDGPAGTYFLTIGNDDGLRTCLKVVKQ